MRPGSLCDLWFCCCRHLGCPPQLDVQVELADGEWGTKRPGVAYDPDGDRYRRLKAPYGEGEGKDVGDVVTESKFTTGVSSDIAMVTDGRTFNWPWQHEAALSDDGDAYTGLEVGYGDPNVLDISVAAKEKREAAETDAYCSERPEFWDELKGELADLPQRHGHVLQLCEVRSVSVSVLRFRFQCFGFGFDILVSVPTFCLGSFDLRVVGWVWPLFCCAAVLLKVRRFLRREEGMYWASQHRVSTCIEGARPRP